MVLAVIPARYASVRFPGKPLADLAGRSVIQRTYIQADSCALVDRTIVATDDERIAVHVRDFGGEVMLTRSDHPSGTDRVAEVAARVPEASIVVNVQGDEPFIAPAQIEAVIRPFAEPTISIATLCRLITDEQALLSPNVVKVVRSNAGRALYFSRHALPYLRDVPVGQWINQRAHYQHLGLYAYRASILPALTRVEEGELEQLEKLEQLRWLAAGYAIHVGITERAGLGIDTPADLEAARAYLMDSGRPAN